MDPRIPGFLFRFSNLSDLMAGRPPIGLAPNVFNWVDPFRDSVRSMHPVSTTASRWVLNLAKRVAVPRQSEHLV